jgi:hypothetical protein
LVTFISNHFQKNQNFQEKTMIISDLSHLEVASEENKVQGGIAFADAFANASAKGRYFAATYTNTYTSAYSSHYYNSASSNSSSSSSAD